MKKRNKIFMLFLAILVIGFLSPQNLQMPEENTKREILHLHYTIITLIPYLWQFDSESKQGWKKMFYLNPTTYLTEK